MRKKLCALMEENARLKAEIIKIERDKMGDVLKKRPKVELRNRLPLLETNKTLS